MILKVIINKIKDLLFSEKTRFKGHYDEWRVNRMKCIVDYYGKNFFKDKKVLELGCGYGDIGAVFASMGAEVTCSDAREEHLITLRKRYPHIKTVQADLNDKWPFRKKFDLILHLGTLYHLKMYEQHLRRVCKAAKNLVLETEVCDSNDPQKVIFVKEKIGYDQSIGQQGCRPSPANLEMIFKSCGMRFKRVRTNRLNSDAHRYNWKIKNTGEWSNGLRRIWFVENLNL